MVLAVIAVRVFAATDVLSEGYIHRDDGGRGAIPLHASCQSLHQLTDIIVRCALPSPSHNVNLLQLFHQLNRLKLCLPNLLKPPETSVAKQTVDFTEVI